MQKLRTALVGCGKVGHSHAAALKSLPESEFVAASDAEVPEAVDGQPGCPRALDRIEDLVDPFVDKEIDGRAEHECNLGSFE